MCLHCWVWAAWGGGNDEDRRRRGKRVGQTRNGWWRRRIKKTRKPLLFSDKQKNPKIAHYLLHRRKKNNRNFICNLKTPRFYSNRIDYKEIMRMKKLVRVLWPYHGGMGCERGKQLSPNDRIARDGASFRKNRKRGVGSDRLRQKKKTMRVRKEMHPQQTYENQM